MLQEHIVANQNYFILAGKIIFVCFIIWLVIYIITSVIRNHNNLSSPGNITAIQRQQNTILDARWLGNMQSKQGLASQFQSIPQDQQLLINANIFSTRLVGYLGPFDSGVFEEDTATRLALSTGARCLILEIDYDNHTYDPKLIYRDGWGMKRSLNAGSIQKVAKSIAARAFSPQNDGVPASVASDPLILVVYFVRAPNQGKEALEYMRYLGAVAEQLQPLKDYLIAQTPQGDFRRQALESQLFFTDYRVFQRKIILLTNADTTGFRKLASLGLAGELGQKQDLDFMTHVRLYGRESPSQFGITGTPISSVKPAAVITSPGYWTSTPTDRAASAVESTKESWTLVMNPVSTATNQPDQKTVDSLFKTYGVHSIPTTLFADATATDVFTAKDMTFNKSVWAAKSQLLRYVPPRPIPIQHPYPQANSGGGKVVAPKI